MNAVNIFIIGKFEHKFERGNIEIFYHHSLMAAGFTFEDRSLVPVSVAYLHSNRASSTTESPDPIFVRNLNVNLTPSLL